MKINEIGVLLLAYNRPEMLLRRINELERMEIDNLYISIDGGPKSHTNEMAKAIKLARKSLKHVKNLKIMHYEENLGLVNHFNLAVSEIFDNHNYIIFLEDDVSLNENFIINMVQGFVEHAKFNSIGFVSGWSPIYSKLLPNRWRTAFYPFMWGIGFSKETWKLYNKDFKNLDIENSLRGSVKWERLTKFQKKHWLRKFEKIKENPNYTYDYQLAYLSFKFDAKNLSPIFTMSGNEGFNDHRGVHTLGKKPRFITNKYLNDKLIRKKLSLSRTFKFFDSNIAIRDSRLLYLCAGSKKRIKLIFTK